MRTITVNKLAANSRNEIRIDAMREIASNQIRIQQEMKWLASFEAGWDLLWGASARNRRHRNKMSDSRLRE